MPLASTTSLLQLSTHKNSLFYCEIIKYSSTNSHIISVVLIIDYLQLEPVTFLESVSANEIKVNKKDSMKKKNPENETLKENPSLLRCLYFCFCMCMHIYSLGSEQ